MRIIKTKNGTYVCPRGHKSDQAILIEDLGAHQDGVYCAACFDWTVISRLGTPRVDLVIPHEPESEPDPPEESKSEETPNVEEETAGDAGDAGDTEAESA
jgi:hypothetical protein